MKAISKLLDTCIDSSGATIRPKAEDVAAARKELKALSDIVTELAVEPDSGLSCTLKRLIRTAHKLSIGGSYND